MITVAIANQKGGCAKTTTAVNLGAALAAQGLPVLIIDTDPQGHVAKMLGLDLDPVQAGGLSRWLDGTALAEAAAIARDNLAIVAADKTLDAVITKHLLDAKGRLPANYLAARLRRANSVAFALIDTSPSANQLQAAAIAAADLILIPVACDPINAAALVETIATIDAVADLTGRRRDVAVLPTMYDPRNRLDRTTLDTLRATVPGYLLPPIQRRIAVAEAAGQGQPIIEYARRSPAAEQYIELAWWLRRFTRK